MTESEPLTKDELEAQLDTVERLLELNHGDAVRFEQSEAAWAYATALEMLDEARAGEYCTGDDLPQITQRDSRAFTYSRASRRAGWGAAALVGQYRPDRDYTLPPTLFERLVDGIRAKLGRDT